MPELQVVTVSTRPGRHGPKLAQWFVERARELGRRSSPRDRLAQQQHHEDLRR
jgi:hypothetical protein